MGLRVNVMEIRGHSLYTYEIVKEQIRKSYFKKEMNLKVVEKLAKMKCF